MSNEKTIQALTPTNWYTGPNTSLTGTAQEPTGSNPNVQIRLVSDDDTSRGGTVTYSDFNITPLINSFEFNMEILWTTTDPDGAGDYYRVTFGNNSSFSILFMFWSGSPYNNGFSGAGVYLLDSLGRAIAKSASTTVQTGPGQNQWFPVSVKYDGNATNTWTVLINNVTVLTYRHPNPTLWQQVEGNRGVAVHAWSGGGLRMNLFVRKLSLVYKAKITSTISFMPPKFYPSADDSTFSSNRASYARSIYPRITIANVENESQITKQKKIYNRHDASSRIERLKLQAIGQSSMRIKENETLQFKAPNVNDVRDALRRSRSRGYVVKNYYYPNVDS
jgi:hypothetical protein